MARAAHALAEATRAELDKAAVDGGRILVLAGGGNNGGDALFAAAELQDGGIDCAILPVASRLHGAGLRTALEAGVRLLAEPGVPTDQISRIAADLASRVRVVIDGVLGTGSAGRADLRGTPLAAIKALLTAQARGAEFTVVAVDLPSGLDPDTGEAASAAVLPADVTVTFGACKAGLLIGAGPELAGRVRVVDIGLLSNLAGQTPLVRGD